jgi:hypothetical protein
LAEMKGVTMRYYEILNCEMCPNLQEYDNMDCRCSVTEKLVEPFDEPPEWCPLPKLPKLNRRKKNELARHY